MVCSALHGGVELRMMTETDEPAQRCQCQTLNERESGLLGWRRADGGDSEKIRAAGATGPHFKEMCPYSQTRRGKVGAKRQ